MTPYESRPASWRVSPVGSPLYSELVTEVAITDEAAGEFVEVRQSGRTDIGKIAAAPDLLEALHEMVDLVGMAIPFDGPQQRKARKAIARATGDAE